MSLQSRRVLRRERGSLVTLLRSIVFVSSFMVYEKHKENAGPFEEYNRRCIPCFASSLCRSDTIIDIRRHGHCFNPHSFQFMTAPTIVTVVSSVCSFQPAFFDGRQPMYPSRTSWARASYGSHYILRRNGGVKVIYKNPYGIERSRPHTILALSRVVTGRTFGEIHIRERIWTFGNSSEFDELFGIGTTRSAAAGWCRGMGSVWKVCGDTNVLTCWSICIQKY